MKIATWNINSARARAERILNVLERHDLDVLALQEIKCKPEQFPAAEIEAAGYEIAAHGLNQWNGVAIISRVGLSDVRYEFPGQPGFTKGIPDDGSTFINGPVEARAIGASVGGIDVWSLYVPNGRAVGDPHYFYKLEFLRALRDFAQDQTRQGVDLALVGDWNVIPTDDDVWDPSAMEDDIYMTDAERAAFHAFADAGMREVSRDFATNYTFWDYQKLRFPKNEGLRIDYVWASEALADHAIAGSIDRDERKGKGASDHVPVIVEFA
ncbi:exodeoxyribonuclease III [Arcanobacterium buesumense]|uniref:Exodeoxyribonuclease III n=1 Tax=Arcanobacterium buesumense TaxID=2722751 RepID=A0A6H2EKJ1_9ACTO|nr:exodeoxyribonuclease III [Arcanobacterium buesumense]QJC21217.1 exodeoxyribonuclease III [Arcanobacterium buesumense]